VTYRRQAASERREVESSRNQDDDDFLPTSEKEGKVVQTRTGGCMGLVYHRAFEEKDEVGQVS